MVIAAILYIQRSFVTKMASFMGRKIFWGSLKAEQTDLLGIFVAIMAINIYDNDSNDSN